MKHASRWFLAGLILMGLVFYFFNRVPRINGHSLRYWVNELHTTNDWNARLAIHKLNRKALPFLISAASRKENDWTMGYEQFYKNNSKLRPFLPAPVNRRKAFYALVYCQPNEKALAVARSWLNKEEDCDSALTVVWELGEAASALTSDLTQHLKSTNANRVQGVLYAMSLLGPEVQKALPQVRPLLTNANPALALYASSLWIAYSSEPQIGLNAFATAWPQLSQSTNQNASLFLPIQALQFGELASPLQPYFLELAQNGGFSLQDRQFAALAVSLNKRVRDELVGKVQAILNDPNSPVAPALAQGILLDRDPRFTNLVMVIKNGLRASTPDKWSLESALYLRSDLIHIVEELKSLQKSANPGVPAMVNLAFIALGGPEARTLLQEALKTNPGHMTPELAFAAHLGKLVNEETLKDMRRWQGFSIYGDASIDVCDHLNTQSAKSLEKIKKGLTHPNGKTRSAYLSALRLFWAPLEPFAAEMELLKKDPHVLVRQWALRVIEARDAEKKDQANFPEGAK